MMKINKHNYEIFFLDYHEGNLDASTIEELLVFVENNPDLQEEFESFEEISIPVNESIKLDIKSDLKKTSVFSTKNINEKNYEEYFLAYFENDLPEKECTEILEFADKNPSLKKEFELSGKVFLTPDSSITYDNKSSLKKHLFYPARIIYYSIGIAASLLILTGIYFLLSPKQNTRDYATNSPTKLPLNITGFKLNILEPVSHKEFLLEKESTSFNIIIERKKSELEKLPLLQQNNIEYKTFASSGNDKYFITPRYEYISLYERIKMTENTLYAKNNKFDLTEKTLPGKIFSFAYNSIKKVFKKNIDPVMENSADNPAIWAIAQAGISGYNYLTDNNVQLNKKFDDKGKIIAYSFNSDDIRFYKRVKQK